MAKDNLTLLSEFLDGSPTEFSGVSMGTYLEWLMAEMNLAANEKDQLNLQRVKLVASAVVAKNVPENESFRDPNIDEDAMRLMLTVRFLLHLSPETVHMMFSNPADLLGCAPMAGAYALQPHKAKGRARAIKEDFKDVQQGVDWEVVKRVASAYKILVVGGGRDPLVQFQIPQWEAAQALFPENVAHRVIPNKGHLISADARGTVAALADMESSQTDFAQAA